MPEKVKKAAKKKTTQGQKKAAVTSSSVRDNVRCRQCLIVDGYTKGEQNCRHCGAKLFKEDIL